MAEVMDWLTQAEVTKVYISSSHFKLTIDKNKVLLNKIPTIPGFLPTPIDTIKLRLTFSLDKSTSKSCLLFAKMVGLEKKFIQQSLKLLALLGGSAV
ncbi:MAG: hypothetical protein VKL59_19450 [Nostocaceae cyanobacterium]|nr:hypothetical protein [Nostocaceae cyanobacterium]